MDARVCFQELLLRDLQSGQVPRTAVNVVHVTSEYATEYELTCKLTQWAPQECQFRLYA